MKALAGNRHQTHWQAAAILPTPKTESQPPLITPPLFDKPQALGEFAKCKAFGGGRARHPHPANLSHPTPLLPTPTEAQDLIADYTSLGLTLGRHPLALLREAPEAPFSQCKRAADLQAIPHGRLVQISGLVTGRQRPGTASGVIFLTLEDETGNINVIIWPRTLQAYRPAVLQGRLLKIKGVLERQQRVTHIIAGHIEDLSAQLHRLPRRSRDFR